MRVIILLALVSAALGAPQETNKLIPEPDAEEKATSTPKFRRGCGHRNPNGVGIRDEGLTDSQAQFGEFPWMVAIFKKEVIGGEAKVLNKFRGGGSLINTRVVLTDAVIVHGNQAKQLKIRAGEWNTQTTNELYAHQDRDVESIVVHENFDPDAGTVYNDVALLILKTPVELAENVDVVCLPPPNQNFDGSRCFASGWGKDKYDGDGSRPAILKKVELPIVPRDECQNSLRSTKREDFILHESSMCAGGELGRDTCTGDGGGPLVCPIKTDPSRYVQAGIVSWGIGCGKNQIPGVYANVAALRQWIDDKMALNHLDVTVYQA